MGKNHVTFSSNYHVSFSEVDPQREVDLASSSGKMKQTQDSLEAVPGNFRLRMEVDTNATNDEAKPSIFAQSKLSWAL